MYIFRRPISYKYTKGTKGTKGTIYRFILNENS